MLLAKNIEQIYNYKIMNETKDGLQFLDWTVLSSLMIDNCGLLWLF